MPKGFSSLIKDKPLDIGGDFNRVSDIDLIYKKKEFKSKFHYIPSVDEAWVNNKYVVMIYIKSVTLGDWHGNIKHLLIKPIDEKPIKNHWKVCQNIKNILCGNEWTGIEIYPKMSTLVDEANVYHIWVFPEDFSLGFGIHLPGWF